MPVRWMLGLGQRRVDLRREMLTTAGRSELARACLQRRRASGINPVGQLAIEL